VHADRADAAGVLERSTRPALQHVKRVRVGIAQRPELIARREHHVQREQREFPGNPAGRCDEARSNVAIMAGDLLADKREEALRVRVALDEAAASPEARLELRKVSDHAVVGEQTTFLLEWMRVRRNQTTGRGETDVGDEGLRLHISRSRAKDRSSNAAIARLSTRGSALAVK